MWLGSVFFVSAFFWSYVLTQDCYTPQGQRSSCISLYECPDLLRAVQQKPLLPSTRDYLKRSQCGFEGTVPVVCCGPVPSENTERPGRGTADSVSSEDSRLARDCGVDTTGDKLYGGVDTELDEHPWMVLLGYRTRAGKITYQCGGVLINKRYVMTAAHCITGAIEQQVGILTTVRLGEYDTTTDVDCKDSSCAPPVQEINVDAGYAHPGYQLNNGVSKDDIGIIRLSKRANYTYFVKPICLADNVQRLQPNDNLMVAGWGKTLNGRNSPVKQKLAVPVFNKQKCVEKYRTLKAEISDKQLCAGGEFAKDSCRGDSGGPLMSRRSDGVWEAVGVVSYGNGCGRDGWPGIYTSVPSYISWIKEKLQETNQ